MVKAIRAKRCRMRLSQELKRHRWKLFRRSPGRAPGTAAEREQRRHEEIRRDPAAFHFFSARSNHQPLVSSAGTHLTQQAFRQNGRALGSVVQMRTYAALNETTLEEGASTAPILFWEEVLAQLKQRTGMLPLRCLARRNRE